MEKYTFIAHHGILGQKWGVRRYQNADGTLTDAGKKRYSSDAVKLLDKAARETGKKYNRIYVDAYNKTANEYNNGKIEQFNKKHSSDDPDYFEAYEKQFNKDFGNNIADMMVSELKNNKNYQKGMDLVNKYKLDKYDDDVKRLMKEMESVGAR